MKKKRISTKDNKDLREFIKVIILIFILFASFFIPYYYFKNKKVFEYEGLKWQIEREGNITFYHTEFNKTFNNITYGIHKTFFRNDPRKNKIPVQIERYAFYKNIIITSSPEALLCDKEILVNDALYQITLAMPLYNKNVTTAINNKKVSEEYNQPYITCEYKPEKTTVINIEIGNESKIEYDSTNKCYKLYFKNCSENLLVAEKFIMEIIKQLNKNLNTTTYN